jgi:hypothetical protein
MNAKSKNEKARVITTIVLQVRDAAGPQGGFVKKLSDGEWIEVGLVAAREKVGKLKLVFVSSALIFFLQESCRRLY